MRRHSKSIRITNLILASALVFPLVVAADAQQQPGGNGGTGTFDGKKSTKGGENTSDAAKDVAHGTKKAAVKTGDATADASKATAKGTAKAADKTADAAKATAKATKKAAVATGDATKKAADKTVDAVK